MTMTAVNPQVRAGTGSAPARTAGPRPRRVPLTPMRHAAAKSMRKLAGGIAEAHPDMSVHQHVRDAARMLDSGNEEAAQRHLRAAMFALTPQSLMRNGAHDDGTHIAARAAMHGVHRHLLLVKDIADAAERNREAIARDSYGGLESAPSLPSSPLRPDPNAGYGPGALAQKPTARQPGGDRALNAPARTNSGGSDPAVADPVGPQPRGSKQFARTWDEVARVIDLAAWGRALDEERAGGGWSAATTEAASQKAHDTASATAKRDWLEARGGASAPAASLHGKAVLGRTAQGNTVRGTYDHNSGEVLDRAGGRTAVTHVQPAPAAPAPLPAAAPSSLPGNIFASQTPGIGLAYGWDDLAAVVELSAETGRLAVTPAPRGKPGGPGLYDVAGLGHTAYEQQIVKALVEKRGMPPGKAYAIARASIRKWMVKSKHPEVKAAAGAAEAGELEKQARAKAMHGHANTWDDVAAVVELAAAAAVPGQMAAAGQPVSAAKSANATAQARVGAGSPAGGQFAPAGSGGGGSKKPADAHQQHVAHLQHLATHGTPAQKQAARSALARLNAGSSKKPASKATGTPAAAKTAAKPGAAKASSGKTASTKTASKATASKTASVKAKATAHQAHLAHVAHLQHLATHGNPAQRKAAASALARLGVKA